MKEYDFTGFEELWRRVTAREEDPVPSPEKKPPEPPRLPRPVRFLPEFS